MPKNALSFKQDLWTEAEKPQDEIIARLSDEDFLGIVIAAPETVPLGSRSSLPLIGFRGVSTTEENFKASLPDQAVLVATQVESNQTYVAPAFEWIERPAKKKPAGASDVDATIYAKFALDVRERIEGLPWHPGSFRLTVLLLGQRSNTVISRLLPAPPLDDPEVAEILLKKAPIPPPKPISPPAAPGLHSYKEEKESPKLAATPGIAISVPRAMVVSPGAKCMLRGSFELPLRPHEIVRRGELPKPGEVKYFNPPLPEVGDPEASAVIAVTIVVAGHDSIGAQVFNLRVPSYTVIGPDAKQPTVKGYFNVDLLSLSASRQPQNYSVWAFSGEAIAGPVKMALVTPDMLPAT